METSQEASPPATIVECYDVLSEACPSRQVLNRVADRWTMLVVLALESGTLRFSQLRRAIGGVTQKMLTQTLRALERDGMVIREVEPTVPVTVRYSLSPLGVSLAGAVDPLRRWAYGNMPAITQARADYDGRTAPGEPTRAGSGAAR